MFGGYWAILTFSEARCQGIRIKLFFNQASILPRFRRIAKHCSPVQFFVTKTYTKTEHGTYNINSDQEYEYEVSARALPLSVGDTVRVPVHPTGHGGGKAFTTSYLQLQVTDIYSTPKFHAYHDRIEG
jgi:hypothetical protein